MKQTLIIVALRRSGSTVFWETLRQDSRFFALNEPFNPLIRRLGDRKWIDRHRKHYSEYEELLCRDGPKFWDHFDAIHDIQELQQGFSDRQRAYAEYLFGESPHLLMETTRCHFKLRELAEISGPNAVVVHLYRSPESFATSHLLRSSTNALRSTLSPTRRSLEIARGTLERLAWKRMFWSPRRRYDLWGVESVVTDGCQSKFFGLLPEYDIDPRTVAEMSAVGRLLTYWRVGFQQVERDGRKLFGPRFLSVSLEGWCENPLPALKAIYAALGNTMPEFDLSTIRKPGPPHDATNAEWRRLRRVLELDRFAPPIAPIQ